MFQLILTLLWGIGKSVDCVMANVINGLHKSLAIHRSFPSNSLCAFYGTNF